MTALVRRRRRRTLVALVAGVLTACLLPVALFVGARAVTTSRAAVNVGLNQARQIPVTPAAFFGTVDDEGQLTSLTIFTLAPGGAGGTVVSVPVGTQVQLGADDDHLETLRLADVYMRYGVEGFQPALESAMHLTFATGDVVDRADATRYLGPVPPVSVSSPIDLFDTTADGDVVVVEAGEQELDPSGLASVLLARRSGEAESARLPYLRALWDGVANAVGDGQRIGGDPLAPPGTVPTELRTFMAATFAGPVSSYQFAYTAIEPDGVAEASDLYELDLAEVVLVFASVAPSSVVAANPAFTVQLDSSFDFRVTKEAVGRLLYAGANVLLVRQLDDSPPSTTTVRSTVRLDDQQLDALDVLLGAIEIQPQDDRVEGIEVQMILGADFLDVLEAEQAQRERAGGVEETGDDGDVEAVG